MELREINAVDEIVSVMTLCKQDFYLFKYEETNAIIELASKFSKFGNFIVLSDESIAGFIAFYANDRRTFIAYISMLIVKKEYQAKGFGKLLLFNAIAKCKSEGMRIIKLEVNRNNLKAIDFYTKYGFSFLQNTGDETIYMIKSISDCKSQI